MDAYTGARALIDAAHATDPHRTADGRPAELMYADRMEAWVARLAPAAPPHLRLAARCQHLERWSVARTSFPLGRAGYLAWRKSLYGRQAARAAQLLRQAGAPAGEATEVATWVAKSGLKTNAGTQALEDAACLVFLETELETFAAQHAGYPRAKLVDIVRKTWRKMSAPAREFALGLPLAPAVAALVREATAGAPPPAPA
jgi:tRNAThr (cytosine32-N3)-methyltransferase